jgi:hypothetical protein
MKRAFEPDDIDDSGKPSGDSGADMSAAILGIFANVPFLRLDDVVSLMSDSASTTDTTRVRVHRGLRSDIEGALRQLVASRLLMTLSSHRFALNRRENSPLAVAPRAALMSDRLFSLIATQSMKADEIARSLDVRQEAVDRALASAQLAGKVEQFKVPGRGVFWRAAQKTAAAHRKKLSKHARLLLDSLTLNREADFAELSQLSGINQNYVARLALTLEERGYVVRRKHDGIVFVSRIVDKAIPAVPESPPPLEPFPVPRLKGLSKQASLLYSHVPSGSELNLQELVVVSGLGKTYVAALTRVLDDNGYVVRRQQGNRIFVTRAGS